MLCLSSFPIPNMSFILGITCSFKQRHYYKSERNAWSVFSTSNRINNDAPIANLFFPHMLQFVESLSFFHPKKSINLLR